MPTQRMRAALACLVAGALAAPATAQAADQLAGVTDGNTLVLFQSDAPGEIQYSVPLSGLAPGERIVGLDRRPATGGLMALGATSRIYAVDAASGAANAIGNPFTPALNGSSFGFSFNPTADRARSVSDAGQNVRINPDNGNVSEADGNLQYAAGDAGAGTTPSVIAAAYTNSVAGATSTTLYDIDAARDALVIQNPPNDGTLNTVGALGVDVTGPGGFDISPFTNSAFAALRRAGQTNPELFEINLQNGNATAVGPIAPQLSSRATAATPVGPIVSIGQVASDNSPPAVSIALSSTQLENRLLTKGIVMTVACDEACSASTTATLGGSNVGSGEGQVLASAGLARVTIPLSETAKSRLRRPGTVRLTGAVTVRDSAGNTITTNRFIRSRLPG